MTHDFSLCTDTFTDLSTTPGRAEQINQDSNKKVEDSHKPGSVWTTNAFRLAFVGWTMFLHSHSIFSALLLFPFFSSIHLYLHPLASCPVTLLSITPSPSLCFCSLMPDIFLLNTHGVFPLAQTHSTVYTHTLDEKCSQTCTHIKKQEINTAFWNAKPNSIQLRKAACCWVSNKLIQALVGIFWLHLNLKGHAILNVLERDWRSHQAICIEVVVRFIVARQKESGKKEKKHCTMRTSAVSVISLWTDHRIIRTWMCCQCCGFSLVTFQRSNTLQGWASSKQHTNKYHWTTVPSKNTILVTPCNTWVLWVNTRVNLS